jgi:DNA repair exonuclease SbcCD nuclease subunit
MRLLLYADPHWSVTSSIVRTRGEVYSTRLENLIKSINWVEETAHKSNCDAVVCLGDFFDTAQLNSEEITALGEIRWTNCNHYFIVGNHEMGRGDLAFSSSKIFDLCPKSCVIDTVTEIPIYDHKDTKIVCIPYILEKNRKPLTEYLSVINDIKNCENTIIFSHNDIKGIQMGMFKSTEGFDIQEIQDNCNLFVNGHLHNGGVVAQGVINLGNLTGQNFSEDGYKYEHNVMLIDTATHEVEWVVNPNAFNFYKIDMSQYTADDTIDIHCDLTNLKPNSVVSLKVAPCNEEYVKKLLTTMDNIIESRVTIDMSATATDAMESIVRVDNDHINKFMEFVRSNLECSNIVIEELNKIGGAST